MTMLCCYQQQARQCFQIASFIYCPWKYQGVGNLNTVRQKSHFQTSTSLRKQVLNEIRREDSNVTEEEGERGDVYVLNYYFCNA